MCSIHIMLSTMAAEHDGSVVDLLATRPHLYLQSFMSIVRASLRPHAKRLLTLFDIRPDR